MDTRTIAAIITPAGTGGVAIIRVSGPQTRRVAEALTGTIPEPRKACFSPFKGADGETLDEGLALFFAAPHSFTGEDVLELQGHGGVVVANMVLQACLQAGAELARPGEFSEQAFLNGRMDLVQAEAVADLIEAGSQQAVQMACRSMRGEFSRQIEQIVEQITGSRAHLEAWLDFPDEDIDPDSLTLISEQIQSATDAIEILLVEAEQGAVMREGLYVVLAGPPNAGKSSLLNRFTGEDTAIVTSQAGTTRDVLRQQVLIDGLPIHLIDTAGLRSTDDQVEQEGVRRSYRAAEEADLVLWVVEASQPVPIPAPFSALGREVLEVRNKIDLVEKTHKSDDKCVYISAKESIGIDILKERIHQIAGLNASSEGIFLARKRHVEALRQAHTHTEKALSSVQSGLELVAENLRLAQQALGEITGEFSADDLLGKIFSEFCIGK